MEKGIMLKGDLTPAQKKLHKSIIRDGAVELIQQAFPQGVDSLLAKEFLKGENISFDTPTVRKQFEIRIKKVILSFTIVVIFFIEYVLDIIRFSYKEERSFLTGPWTWSSSSVTG